MRGFLFVPVRNGVVGKRWKFFKKATNPIDIGKTICYYNRRSSSPELEGCPSGWRWRSWKPLSLKGFRGFESHPLRQRPKSWSGLWRVGRVGRRRSPAKRVYGPKPVSRVRIPCSPPCALIAQPDRVFGYEPKGRRFESCWAHQIRNSFTIGIKEFLFLFYL